MSNEKEKIFLDEDEKRNFESLCNIDFSKIHILSRKEKSTITKILHKAQKRLYKMKIVEIDLDLDSIKLLKEHAKKHNVDHRVLASSLIIQYVSNQIKEMEK